MSKKPILEKTRKTSARIKLSADEENQLLYIINNTLKFGSYELDLSDPVQYGFVKNCLLRTGELPEKSAMTFDSLAKAQKKGKKQKPGLPRLEQMYIKGSATDQLVPIHGISSFTKIGNKYRSTAFSSYPGGTFKTSIIQNIMAVNKDKIAAIFSQITTQYIKGQNLKSTFEARLPEADGYEAVSLACFLVFPTDGSVKAYTVLEKQKMQKEQPPAENEENGTLKFAPAGGEAAVAYTFDAPCHINTAEPNPIRVAFGPRVSPADDYSYPSAGGAPANFNFPLAGSLTFMNSITLDGAYPRGLVRVSLITTEGGGYVLYASTPSVRETEEKLEDFTASGSTLSWNFPQAAFPRTSDTLPHNGTYELYVELQVNLDSGNPGFGNFSSDASKVTEGTWKIPYIEICWGCLIPGTMIKMADGSLKKVEDFKGDGTEKVIVNSKGGVRAVTATTTGTENKPCVFFKDSNKKSLMLTQDHPVVTKNRGVILAKYLKKGDTVITEKGPSKITEVVLKKYSGKIWNLELGTLKDAAGDKTTMFADGFLVGDNSMQQYYCSKDLQKRRTEPLKELPAEWHKEYKNFIKPAASKKKPSVSKKGVITKKRTR